jgi:hypothetical protein
LTAEQTMLNKKKRKNSPIRTSSAAFPAMCGIVAYLVFELVRPPQHKRT